MIDAGSIPADLVRPGAYPPPRPDRVDFLSTHASWVFLTGREAWKVKRPVRFGFLDYSTQELRRRACEDEVRLNRRLAPDVYLGVEPLRLGPAGHTFTGEGPVVDWAVRMRRLPDDASAEAMLARGALAPAHLEALVRRLVPFYRSVESDPAAGSPEALRSIVEDNLRESEAFVGRFLERSSLDAVRRWVDAFLLSRRDRFAARAAAGRIREGHGDLRLEHVYFGGAEPLLIDCIEFNRRYRVTDTASDTAFLAMELEARGRGDLAEGFLARFAELSNDFELYDVVDLYLVHRAWVRGLVAAIVAADPSTPEPKRGRKEAEARARFDQALRRTRPPAGGPVIAVGGMIGSGKSTIAGALRWSLGLPVAASDATRKSLAGLEPSARGGDELYTPEMDRRTFDEMLRRADGALRSGRGVLLDATFRSRELRLRARELARRHGRRFLFIEAACDEETLKARLRARESQPSVSDAREGLLARFQAGFEPVTELEPGELLRLHTERPLDVLLAEAWTRIPGPTSSAPSAPASRS